MGAVILIEQFPGTKLTIWGTVIVPVVFVPHLKPVPLLNIIPSLPAIFPGLD